MIWPFKRTAPVAQPTPRRVSTKLTKAYTDREAARLRRCRAAWGVEA